MGWLPHCLNLPRADLNHRMFDSTCKFLAESFSRDFASWLMGKPIDLTKLSPTELSLEPIRADSLILFQSDEVVLQIEFQTKPDPNMAFRLADYRLRVYRRFPQKEMKQVVVYLTPSSSDYVFQTAFEIPGTHHEFEVVRLWEQPTPTFLESTGLLPLAVLTDTPDQLQTLRKVAERIDVIPELRVQSNLAASTGILAGLTLEKDFINQILRKEIMQQSVIYQEWKEEFLQEGRQEEGQSLILRLLNRRIGDVPSELRSQIQSLPLDQIEALGEALLEFKKPADLVSWLEKNSSQSS